MPASRQPTRGGQTNLETHTLRSGRVIQKPAAKPDNDSPKGPLRPDAEAPLTHPFIVSEGKEQSNPASKSSSSMSEEASKPGITSSYSKRANRGYNPKYEQSAFVSFGPLVG